MCTYVRGGAIKIGARPFWGRGVFVLVIWNINIGYQKSLTPPLGNCFPNIKQSVFTFQQAYNNLITVLLLTLFADWLSFRTFHVVISCVLVQEMRTYWKKATKYNQRVMVLTLSNNPQEKTLNSSNLHSVAGNHLKKYLETKWITLETQFTKHIFSAPQFSSVV